MRRAHWSGSVRVYRRQSLDPDIGIMFLGYHRENVLIFTHRCTTAVKSLLSGPVRYRDPESSVYDVSSSLRVMNSRQRVTDASDFRTFKLP